MTGLPLSGIRVLDLSESLAGPYCTQILADLGADVLKVERPRSGDAARHWGPPFVEGHSTFFLAANRNKRSLALDLKTGEGREILRRLVARCDIFVQSFRAGVVESLGLGWEALHAEHPALIYCSVSAYGTKGPRRKLPGYDPLLQAYGGIMSVTGYPGQPPARVGTSLVDMGTGMWAALSILAALRERDRSGRGTHLVASLLDTTVAWMAYHLAAFDATGERPAPQGSALAMIAPYEAFPTADGSLMIAAATDDLFRRACAALALPAVAEDPRFLDNPSRVEHRQELFELLAQTTRNRFTADVQARLEDAGVPCAPIQAVDDVARDPQVEASGVFRASPHQGLEHYREVLFPVEWAGKRLPSGRAPPRLGEHTHEVLEELGYAADDVERLVSEGVVAL